MTNLCTQPAFAHLTPEVVASVAAGQVTPAHLATETLVEFIQLANAEYRAGNPLIADERYDFEFLPELQKRDPAHPLLSAVEPEPLDAFSGERIKHPEPMLSTDKAYTAEERSRFVDRLLKAAEELGIDPASVTVRVTPKLDGLAARFDGKRLVTRGDGHYGFDVTRALERGVRQVGGYQVGVGELVMHQPYFESHMACEFEHPRNVMVGLVNADEVNEYAQAALEAGAARFVPYAELSVWEGACADFLAGYEAIAADLKAHTEYAMDGLVAEVTHPDIKRYLGANAKFHRWQIALKEAGETAVARVIGYTFQTGRTGRVTPVVEIEPTRLSGATIRRVTAHHAGMLMKLAIGPDAHIKVIRSGEVIPKIIEVVQPSETPFEGHADCPSCGHALEWENDFLVCVNSTGCPAQVENTLKHFFHTLQNVDLFGEATIRGLVSQGITTLEAIYALQADDFANLGFGPGQSANLERELARSRTERVEDWRFLAAFGIRNLGRGDSRRLLQHVPFAELKGISAERIKAIHGFGEVSSRLIADGLADNWTTIEHMLSLGFAIEWTPLLAEQQAVDSPLAGKGVVFTGSMPLSRDEMQNQARALGANVQSSVSKKTDFLVCGEKVGQSKLDKAQKLGVTTLTLADYYALIGQ